jgi:hypothetical protein
VLWRASALQGGVLHGQGIEYAVIFLLLLIVLTLVEETVVGLIHGRGIREVLAGIGGGTLPEVLATSLLLLLILIPYFGLREIAQRLGEGE